MINVYVVCVLVEVEYFMNLFILSIWHVYVVCILVGGERKADL